MSSNRRKWTFVLMGIPFFLGVVLLSSFGPVVLSCDRIRTTQINCSIEERVLLGFVTTNKISIESLTEARVDTKIQEKTEIDGVSSGASPQKVETPVYGVLLLGKTNIVLNDYGYNRKREQAIVDRINSFLKTPEVLSLVIRENNRSSNLLGLGLMILSAAMFVWSPVRK